MSSEDPASKLSTMGAKSMMWVLALIVLLSIAAIGATLFAYLIHFNAGFSTSQEVWGQFGDFVGGLLNPVLSFFALMALVLTVLLQSRQLEMAREQLDNSRAELRATRGQLQRSADAQAQTAAALVEQARHAALSSRLSALSSALQVQSEVVRQSQGVPLPTGFDYQAQVSRKEELAREIMSITDELRSRSGGAS